MCCWTTLSYSQDGLGQTTETDLKISGALPQNENFGSQCHVIIVSLLLSKRLRFLYLHESKRATLEFIRVVSGTADMVIRKLHSLQIHSSSLIKIPMRS